LKEHFRNTIFYQIELTAKYCKLLGAQVFEQFNIGLSVEEYTILDTLLTEQELCQRDLAKLILKDRANTGKLLDGLEKRGLITRKLSVKNNRPVKLIEITELGVKQAEDAASKIRPHYLAIKKQIDNSDIAKVGELLTELRQTLNESLKIQI
jgi:DNA-binding MarR family transcriptional regulator